MEKQPVLEVKNMFKSFGPTKALVDVSLTIREGEIRGLIGENGSGKSTVSSIAAGIQKADSGEMFYKGQAYNPKDNLDASKKGIGMIVQEAGTILNITVAENIFAGKEGRFSKFGFVNKKAMERAAGESLRKLGITDIDPSANISSINYEARKLVEIARVVEDDPDILIADETTTALSQNGRNIIYSIMRDMRDRGKSVMFISHDLEELINICDVLTVLRDGVIIDNLEHDQMDPDRIKELMVGRKVQGGFYRTDYNGRLTDEVVIKVDNVTVGHELERFSMELHKGEILGVGGLSGSGMHELGRAIFGVDKPLTGQVIAVKSGDIISKPSVAIKNSMGYVSKNRDTESIILFASIKDNIMIPSYDKVKTRKLISKKKIKQFTDEQISTMLVKCASREQEVRALSGGNKQKVVFSKWIGTDADILILDCPTRGIDVGVKDYMYQLMIKMKEQGKAILMISEELSELIGLSDRILILKDGHLASEFPRSENLTELDIIKVMI